MSGALVSIITAREPGERDRSLDAFARGRPLAELMAEREALERFRRQSNSLYHRVRALFFLYALHRFHLPEREGVAARGRIPYEGTEHLHQRRFEEAIALFLGRQREDGPSDALSSALAAAYHGLGFQTLADQVQRSVRAVRGNQWMFRMGHPLDHPLRVRPELIPAAGAAPPVLRERTPVRMDLTHSAWSDIFFLGMDYPEGAKVLNVSIDLAVRGRDAAPEPPIETFLRVIDEPLLRLVSVDLRATAEITELGEVFDFARDYLGLLKAAVIAAGLVPPGLEGSSEPLAKLLERLVGRGRGLEITSHVRGIPKGSRLAVSTNLLASLVALAMRATGQASALTGPLTEIERRIAAARAILGEWLGGSGGGWQDSGGLWPAMKLIQGEPAGEGDPEHGVSRGRLLPSHRILDAADASPGVRAALQDSLVLVHGGMAQDVGPILEMVTEKYLLRSEEEWRGRREALGVLDDVLAALRAGDVRALGATTTRNFEGPIQTIIPWATTEYTERLIAASRERFGGDFWGFWMLGGMSGGGMGFLFDPARKDEARDWLARTMATEKRALEHALPFAMEPVVYDFAINADGTRADLAGDGLPPGYYALRAPAVLRGDAAARGALDGRELERFAAAAAAAERAGGSGETAAGGPGLTELLAENGFDREQHEAIRADLRAGRIGLAQNRLPASTAVEEVRDGDVTETRLLDPSHAERGAELLRSGAVAIVTLAAGSGSRWTQGAGVVKALHPFCRLGGRHRSFLEVHLAKSRRTGRRFDAPLPHVVTTSYLTHAPIEAHLAASDRYGYPGSLLLSRGRAVGLRLVPMERDLRFAWEELSQQVLDARAQKVRESLQDALIDWARTTGEGSDYTDNLPAQCLHPVGHWYEVPGLLLNGTLAQLYRERPGLRHLLLHNVDTLGADVDPALLGLHATSGACLSFEVVPRRIQDQGGGLGRIDGRPRLIEGLALPREEDEWRLSYYNSMTTWIDLEQLLAAFGLARDDLDDAPRVAAAVRRAAARLPTYVTLKDVKKRWGYGQEDVFPVTQFEKLWGDMSALPELAVRYLAVPRLRGQQLKEPAQLDGWLRDGSAAYVDGLCDWD